MNSAKSLSAEKKYSAHAFLKFTFKRNWHQFVLYIIIMLFIMAIPCGMEIRNGDLGALGELDTEQQINEIGRIYTGLEQTGIIMSLCLAVISGMSALSYVNSKKSIGCYHSFPIKRESIFASESVSRGIYYLVSVTLGYSITYIMLSAASEHANVFAGEYLRYFIYSIAAYLLLYSVMLFAAGLTGTAPMKLIMTLVILFLPLVLFFLLVLSLYFADPGLNADYYMGIDIIKYFSPVTFFVDIICNKPFWHIVYVFLLSAVFLFGAVILHKYRKSELSGTTVIWKPVFGIVKYSTVFAAALFGIVVFGSGLFFDEFDKMTMIFGAAAGLVLGFIVVNAVMYRSARAIFKGLHGLILLALAVLLFMLAAPFNVFGIFGHPYSAKATKSLIFDVEGTVVEFTDEKEIEKILESLDNEEICLPEIAWEYSKDEKINSFMVEESDEKYSKDFVLSDSDGEYSFETQTTTANIYLTMLQKPKFGIPYSKYVTVDTNGEAWNSIVNSSEYKESLSFDDTIDPSEYTDMYAYIYFGGEKINIDKREDNGEKIMKILSNCDYKGEYRDSCSLEGVVYIGNRNPFLRYIYPIYSADLNMINCIVEVAHEYGELQFLEGGYSSSEGYRRDIADEIDYSLLINTETLEAKKIDNDTLCEISSDLDTFGNTLLRGEGYMKKYFIRSSDSKYLIVSALKKSDEETEKNAATESDHTYVETELSDRYFNASESISRFRAGTLSDAELDLFYNSLP